MRYTGLRSCAVSSVVMICPLIACSTRREARFTVSPNTSSPCWITGPACSPTRSPSLLAPTAGSASTAPSIVAAAATAASALGNSAITSSPMIFTIARFRNANPDRDLLKPAVYVGMTGLTPEERFAKHKAGIRANRYVERFGLRLLPRLYAYANPMPYQAARDMEVELAIALREQGYAVWQA